MEKLFYASNALGSYSLSFGDDPGLTRTTDDAFIIQAKYIDTWNVSFDLNGGTAPEGTDYDSGSQVEKGKTMTVPMGPLKAGYKFKHWKDKESANEYTPGEEIAIQILTQLNMILI